MMLYLVVALEQHAGCKVQFFSVLMVSRMMRKRLGDPRVKLAFHCCHASVRLFIICKE